MRAEREVEAEIRAVADTDGYYLNPDREITEGIIEGIAANEEALGYWRCPCRMSNGDRAQDIDIICPCAYREADVAAYGSCYCNLYVSQAWNQGQIPPSYVPERRPPEKMGF